MNIHLGRWVLAALALGFAIVLQSSLATAERDGLPTEEEALFAAIGAQPLAEARDVVLRPVAPEVDDVLLRAERIAAQAERMPAAPPGKSIAPAFVQRIAERLRARADAIEMFARDGTAREGASRLTKATEGLGEMGEEVAVAADKAR